MKRRGDLWPILVSFSHLLRSAQKAARGKKLWPNVARFLFDQERNLCRLQDDLIDQSYVPGPYRAFLIREPKERLISAAPFRDRVVHHALTGILAPVIEPTFIFDCYACRKGKGTHAALDRFTHYARRYRYVLQGDVRKYFPSINHELLKQLVARKIKDRRVLWLAGIIIDHSNAQEQVWLPGEDLFDAAVSRRGLPLGNQTSQFFANVYLNSFDHFVKETLRAPGYMRYVDDFTIFHDDAGWLAEARERCREFLLQLRLELHPGKSAISRVADGCRFLGFRVFPDHRLLPRPNVRKMRRKLARLERLYMEGILDWPAIQRSVAGWWGHAANADTWRLRRDLWSHTVWGRKRS